MLVHNHPPKKSSRRAFTDEDAYYFSNHGAALVEDDETKDFLDHFVDIDLQVGTNLHYYTRHTLDLRGADLSHPSTVSNIIEECHQIFARHPRIRSVKLDFPPNLEPLILSDFCDGFDLPQWSLKNLFSQSGKVLFSFLREIHYVTVENEQQFPILSHISGITAVKPLPNGYARCELRLDMDFDVHCRDSETKDDFSYRIRRELVNALGVPEESISVGGMSRGSIVLFVFVPLLGLAAAGLIGIAWCLRHNWSNSRRRSKVSRKRLISDPGEEREVLDWDDNVGPDVDIGDTTIFWTNTAKKEHCVGSVFAVELKPEWRVQICLPRNAVKESMWESLSQSANRLGRLFSPTVAPNSDNTVMKWFSLKDWQEGRIEFGPTSERILNRSFRGEIFWGDNSTRWSTESDQIESSLIVYRQFKVYV